MNGKDKICKNCKFWHELKKVYARYYEGYLSKTTCHCPKIIAGSRWYRRKKDQLVYYDFAGEEITFITGENFGCIHFENKGKEK